MKVKVFVLALSLTMGVAANAQVLTEANSEVAAKKEAVKEAGEMLLLRRLARKLLYARQVLWAQ